MVFCTYVGMCVLRAYTHKGVPFCGDTVCCCAVKFCRQRIGRSTDITGNIVTTINLIDENCGVGGFVSTVDMYIATTADVCHTGTAEHTVNITSHNVNGGLTLHITLITAAIYMTANHLSVCRHGSKYK